MIYPFWKSNLGKLFIGGCGTQIGLLFTFGGLIFVLAFCAVCAFSNVLGFTLTQGISSVPTSVPVEIEVSTSSSSQETELLREQIALLLVRVSSLRADTSARPIAPTTTPLPPSPRPVVLASEGAVNLRSGPDIGYNKVGRLRLGESLEIAGRNPDSTWWLVSTPDGLFSWVSDMAVVTFNVDDSIPIVTIPALLIQPTAASRLPVVQSSPAAISSSPTEPVHVPNFPLPAGTPTAAAEASRRFVQDTTGYKQLIRRLLLPTVSESFSPQSDRIAITEKVKLYTIKTDGSSSRILLEDDDSLSLIGNVVWSPDGEYLAFVADQTADCDVCRVVGLVHMANGAISLLDSPDGSGTDLPRWTQDGRLLVTVFWDEPANGTAYIYDISGQGQVAEGDFLLSSSHDGQKWFPWQPGKIWQANTAEQSDNYYGD